MADNFNPNIYSKGLWNMFSPGITSTANLFNQLSQTSGYGMPAAPTMPSMAGVLSGVSPYGISGYGVPSTESIMPTQSWWNNLSGDVKAGAWAPFAEGQNNLLETLGSSGVSGSARGGYSGAAGAALGQYMADATPAYAMNLWNMSSPGAMAGWQAQLGQNQYLAGLQNQQSQALWQNQLTERQTDYQNTLNQANQNYAGQMQAWQLPFNMAMNYNNLAPSGAYHADNGGTLGSIMGAATSIAAPMAMGWGMGGFKGLGGGKGSTGSQVMPYIPAS
jgi:hypothetical protein